MSKYQRGIQVGEHGFPISKTYFNLPINFYTKKCPTKRQLGDAVWSQTSNMLFKVCLLAFQSLPKPMLHGIMSLCDHNSTVTKHTIYKTRSQEQLAFLWALGLLSSGSHHNMSASSQFQLVTYTMWLKHMEADPQLHSGLGWLFSCWTNLIHEMPKSRLA